MSHSGLSSAMVARLSDVSPIEPSTAPEAPDLIAALAPSSRPTLHVHDVATLLGVSIGSVRRWVDDGYLESYRLPGGERRFSAEMVQNFLEVSRG